MPDFQTLLTWRHLLEIFLLAVVFYFSFRAFRSTRGARILVGLLTILLAVTLMVNLLHLEVIGWIITRLAAFLAIALVVIFQPELRNALAKLGSHPFFPFVKTERVEFLGSLSEAVVKLSNNRFGALFAIERGISLKPQAETGVVIDAQFSPELALSIFHPKAALHDGGMILANDRISAAGCVFPVSQGEMSDRSTGLRHRAGIGVTEETDAVAVIVSEETGAISVAYDGKFEKGLAPADFRTLIENIFLDTHEESDELDNPGLDGEDGLPDSSDSGLVSNQDRS